MHTSEWWKESAPMVNFELVRRVWESLSIQEKNDITQYYTAKRRWETKPTVSLTDVARRVRRNYGTVFGWLKLGKRPKAVKMVESLHARDGVLISWPPIKGTLEEFYLKRGMSTHRIAKIFNTESSMVFRWLEKFGVPLRNRVEAYTEAVTKYAKKPFSGGIFERPIW